MRRIGAFAVVVFLSLCTATGFAQNATTSLRGTIKDPSGAVVPGAKITLVNKAAGQTLTATSKGTGEYQLVQIPPATYTITVTATGFGNQTKSAELLVNQPATVDFALTVNSSSVVVDVTEAAQTLNTTDASLGGSTDNATIQAIPSEERNVPDLLSLQPGVFFLPPPSNPAMADSRSGAVNGGRSDQGNITLDGVDDNDQVRGLAFVGVLRETQDSVEEFRVTTANADADAGRSSGAQVSLLTKSGTNKFHGAAYEYFRPSDTVSNDYFNKQAQLSSQYACEGDGGTGCDALGNRPPKKIRNIYGADVGGPIFKDKFFFFANYEAERIAESAIVTQTTPTAAYKAGTITYIADNPSTGNPETETISAAQVAQLDAGCVVCGTTAYPNPPGPNPNALNYLSLLPTANGTSEGDGLNEGSYTFSSPNPKRLNTSIVRLDYVPSSKQRIFVRGNFQKDTTDNTENFPGQPPSSILSDNTKGITFGDTWTFTPNLVNDVRYGYIRQGYGQTGAGSGDYVDFRFLSSPTAETRTTVASVPVNNIVDNLNWTKGKHSMEFGGNWRLVHQNRTSNAASFDGASTNPYWLKGDPPDPGTLANHGEVDSGFTNSYDIAYANLVGTVPSVTLISNYQVTSPTTGTLLADGTPLARHFKANEYEAYAQDSWRLLPNLTITYGVRYTLLETPYETKGQQVSPTIDTHAWYLQRESAALQGQVYEPDLQFSPSGKFYNKPGFYPENKHNFAPRFAIVYAPDPKTSIRAGAGIYYDHFGEGLVNTFDQNGSFGIASSVTNQAGVQTFEGSPRYTARNALPAGINNVVSPTSQTYPFTAPQGNFAITWGIDNHLKTPYTEAFDLSMQHEFPGGFTFELAYVGRLGNHLLQSLDLAEPVDFVDNNSGGPGGQGGDYYHAGAELSKDVDLNGGQCYYCGNNETNPTIPTIQYFEDVFPFMQNQEYMGESATQAIYDLEWAPYRYNYGATTSLADIDFYCGYTDPSGNCPQTKFWQDQFSSLYALSTIGKSYYNAAQFTLRHPMSHGLQMDVSYTFSKSIDWGSDTERVSEFPSNTAGAFSEILNTWKPYLNKGVSDFDTANLLTLDWVYQLPVGKGKHFLAGGHPIWDALFGGWQSSGVYRMTSGLPFSFFEPGWTTDWQIESYGVVTNPGVHAKKSIMSGGNVNYFNGSASTNANAINGGVYNGTPVRLPYPGEAGQRNNFRGDGYLDLDSGLAKMWRVSEFGSLKFTWEVYNVTNTNRFDPASIGSGLTGGNLGTASALLTTPRRMQFSLRFDF